MKQQIVYTLSFLGNLGAFPECMIVDTDEKGVFSSHFTKISSQNKSNYIHLFDEIDTELLALCLKLEKEALVSKRPFMGKYDAQILFRRKTNY